MYPHLDPQAVLSWVCVLTVNAGTERGVYIILFSLLAIQIHIVNSFLC